MKEQVKINQRDSWRKLKNHNSSLRDDFSLRKTFEKDLKRSQKWQLAPTDLSWRLDYGKQLATSETLKLLFAFAAEINVEEEKNRFFEGAPINKTENRAVRHFELRRPLTSALPEVRAVREQMEQFSGRVQQGAFKGASGRPFRHVVNIGIGGSDLGPRMVMRALKDNYAQASALKVHFVSNVDGAHLTGTLKNLDPRETLFLVASKTFTTQETMTNAQSARRWILAAYEGDERAIASHFVALSTNHKAASFFGIDHDLIFPFWDWVGGRFSLTSAVGLSLMLGLGVDIFNELLRGHHLADLHFEKAPLEENLPTLMAFFDFWNANFWDFPTRACLPYAQDLEYWVPFLQQMEMESGGKRVDRQGHALEGEYGTCPILWGAPGTDGQHAFLQLLHQGTQIVPAEFIAFEHPSYAKKSFLVSDHHEKLLANVKAQSEALAFGRTLEEAKALGAGPQLAPYKVFPGNRPSSTLWASKLTPESLGELVALHEHKVFLQGLLWNIYSFDQWGVELGKELALKHLS